jgi:hypothetical protein
MSATPEAATETRTNGQNENQQIATVPAAASLAEQTIAIEERRFALAQRQAKVYADSALVPQEYRGKIGNVLIAQNMAKRMGADTLMVMQNLYIVHGKPGWSAAFLVASFNSNGRFSAIKYRFQGEKHTPEWGCQAYCTENSTGEVIEGTWITWEMATAEGWVSKAGSKWKTMPEQMFRYRAATFLIRSTAPEIGMGLLTKDEIEDMEPTNGNSMANQTRVNLEALKDRLTSADEPEGQGDYVDATILDQPDDTDAAAEAEQPSKPPSKAESQKADHITWIKEFEKESDANGERVAQIIADGDLDSMTPGQVKEIYLELQK